MRTDMDVYSAPEFLAFVRAIREQPEDDTRRLACADWLEEHGEGPRAEFIRVQCELARGPDGIDCEQIIGESARTGDIRYDCYPETPAAIRPPLGSKVAARVYSRSPGGWFLVQGTCRAWVESGLGRGFVLSDASGEEWRPELTARVRALWDIGTNGGGFLELPAHWGTPYWHRGFVRDTRLSAADWLTHADAILARHPVTRVTLTTCPRDDSGRFVNFEEFGRRWDGVTFDLTADAFNAGVGEVLDNTAVMFGVPSPLAGSP
jgi:uncharacterized protein (TIGR02996 family)